METRCNGHSPQNGLIKNDMTPELASEKRKCTLNKEEGFEGWMIFHISLEEIQDPL